MIRLLIEAQAPEEGSLLSLISIIRRSGIDKATIRTDFMHIPRVPAEPSRFFVGEGVE